jgi:hypothetical protein
VSTRQIAHENENEREKCRKKSESDEFLRIFKYLQTFMRHFFRSHVSAAAAAAVLSQFRCAHRERCVLEWHDDKIIGIKALENIATHSCADAKNSFFSTR